MDPTPKGLKARRHRALIRAIDEMCDQLRRETSDPEWFDETEDTLWTDEFFRGVRCDPVGLNIRVQLTYSPSCSGPYDSRTEAICDVAVDREIFADTGRREQEYREILMENIAAGAKTPDKQPK